MKMTTISCTPTVPIVEPSQGHHSMGVLNGLFEAHLAGEEAHAGDRVRAAFLLRLRRLPGPIVVPGQHQMGAQEFSSRRRLELLDRLGVVSALLEKKHPENQAGLRLAPVQLDRLANFF